MKLYKDYDDVKYIFQIFDTTRCIFQVKSVKNESLSKVIKQILKTKKNFSKRRREKS